MSKSVFQNKRIGDRNCAESVYVYSCVCRPTERERTERLIKMRLREIMMQKDLENVTCKEVRGSEMSLHLGQTLNATDVALNQ